MNKHVGNKYIGEYDTRISRAFDRAWNIGKVAVPLGAIAYILAQTDGSENNVPQESYMQPDSGIYATPIIESTEVPSVFYVPSSAAVTSESASSSTVEAGEQD